MKKRQLFALALATSCVMPMMFAGCSSDSKPDFDEYETPSQEYWAIFKGEIGDAPCKIHTVQKMRDYNGSSFVYQPLVWTTNCGYYNYCQGNGNMAYERLFNKDGIMLSIAQYSIGPATAYKKTDLSNYEFCEECFPEKSFDK